MRRLLYMQIGIGLLAAVIFQVGLEQRLAGLIAGTGFVFVGLYGARVGWTWRHHGAFSIAVLVLALIHLFGVALPMLGFRILSWDEPFSKVAVWGLSGPEFHKLSTRFYGIWMFVTGLASWMDRRISRKAAAGK
ncbi:MAG: hypothetical protein RBT63_04700 [Bdellovibrionales bacterium]|nr:hypothetical protein [Bdellovibrionales bacterium]